VKREGKYGRQIRIVKRFGKYRRNCEMIWKIWMKCEMIWKIWQKSKLNSDRIWKTQKKIVK
jgi:hypothetical protein